MAYLRGVYIIWYRDLLRFWRDRARIFSSFIQPFMFLVIFGTGLSSSILLLGPGVNYIQFMFPGIIAMTVLFTAVMWGVSIVWDREFGFLKEVLVAPISRTAVAVGKTLGGATIALFQGILMFVFAPFAGVDLSLGMVLQLLPLMFVMAWALSAMGIFVASLIKSMEAFQVVMQLLMMPLLFLSGALFPVNNLPGWLSALVKLNPVTYGVDPIRQLVLGSMGVVSAAPPSAAPASLPTFSLTLFGHALTIPQEAAVMATFGLVMAALAVWSFGHQE